MMMMEIKVKQFYRSRCLLGVVECSTLGKFVFFQQEKCLIHMGFKTIDHGKFCVHTCLLLSEPGHIIDQKAHWD